MPLQPPPNLPAKLPAPAKPLPPQTKGTVVVLVPLKTVLSSEKVPEVGSVGQLLSTSAHTVWAYFPGIGKIWLTGKEAMVVT